jgi:hypothetical protein
MGDLSDEELDLNGKNRDLHVVPIRPMLVGRRIVGVELLSDEEDVRLVPGPESTFPPGVREVRRGEEGFDEEEWKFKLLLDDGSEIWLGLTDFSIVREEKWEQVPGPTPGYPDGPAPEP